MSEHGGPLHGEDLYEEVDGVPVLPRRRPIAARLRALPARPAVSAAAGGLVVGVAAVGLLQRRSGTRRALLAPSRRRALKPAQAQPFEVARVVTTRSVQVTVQTLIPA